MYFEDLDGDGVSNGRYTVLTGFALSNPWHNFNNPFFGMDNWIDIAIEPVITAKVYKLEFSDKGSPVHYYSQGGVRLPENGNGQRIRFLPDQGA